jgi:hypothetical protein
MKAMSKAQKKVGKVMKEFGSGQAALWQGWPSGQESQAGHCHCNV